MKHWYKYWRSAARKNTISLTLLLAHWLIIVSYAFFLHTHVLEDGTRIVHAHPFQQEQGNQEQEKGKTNSGSSHEHTVFSYTLLSSLNHLFLSNSPHYSFETYQQLFTASYHYFIPARSNLFYKALRAPPFCNGDVKQ